MSKKISKRTEAQSHTTHSGQSPGETRAVLITAIMATHETQSRLAVNQETVAEYAEAMSAGVVFPAVTVFQEGELYWLGDGFHRLEATIKLGMTDISAVVMAGTKKDAILYAIGANRSHGLRRSNDDKRRAVQLALTVPELGELSTRDLAERCGVSHTLVADVRREPEGGIGVNLLQSQAPTGPDDGSDTDDAEKVKTVKAPFVMTAKVIDDGRRLIQQFLASIITLQKHDRGLADTETVRNILELSKKIQSLAESVARSCEDELTFSTEVTTKAPGLSSSSTTEEPVVVVTVI